MQQPVPRDPDCDAKSASLRLMRLYYPTDIPAIAVTMRFANARTEDGYARPYLPH